MVYYQQWHLLRLAGKLCPNPRKQFITDLTTKVIQSWQQAGASIILGGDFNECLGETPDGLALLVTTCRLTDLHASNHGTQDEPNTYSRGSKRSDYIFVFPGIIPFVDISGIAPFHAVINTDHRGLFVDIDLKRLLGGELASILPPQLRGVLSHTTDPGKYILTVHKHLTANKVFTNSPQIFAAAWSHVQVPTPLVQAVNKFDQVVTQAMLLAEIRCRREPRPSWSTSLAAASNAVRFWKTAISGLQTHQDVSLTLHTIGTALNGTLYPSPRPSARPKWP
jgi:hypothetical protein